MGFINYFKLGEIFMCEFFMEYMYGEMIKKWLVIVLNNKIVIWLRFVNIVLISMMVFNIVCVYYVDINCMYLFKGLCD